MRHIQAILVAWGPLGILILSAIESAGIPTPSGTDLLLLVVTAGRPADWVFCAVTACVGSIVGSLIFFEVTRKGGERYLARYTASGRGARFCTWFNRYGLVTVFISALLPIPFMPFKAFSACAGAFGVGRLRYTLVLFVARVPRYFVLAYLGSELGEKSWPWVKSHTWHMIAIAVFLAVALYLLIRYSDRTRRIAPDLP